MSFLPWASLLALIFLSVSSNMKVLGSTSTPPLLVDSIVLAVDLLEIFPDDESVKGYDRLFQQIQEDGKTVYYRADPEHPIFLRTSNDAGKRVIVLESNETYLSPADKNTKIVLRQQESNPIEYTVHMAVISDSNDILWDSVIVEQRKEDEDLIAEFRKAFPTVNGAPSPQCAWIGNMILCSGTTEVSPVDRIDLPPVFNDVPFDSFDGSDRVEWFQDTDARPRKFSGLNAGLALRKENSGIKKGDLNQPATAADVGPETHPNNLRKREISYKEFNQELIPNKTEQTSAVDNQNPEPLESTKKEGLVVVTNTNTYNHAVETPVTITTIAPLTTTTTVPTSTKTSVSSSDSITGKPALSTNTTPGPAAPKSRSSARSLIKGILASFSNQPMRKPIVALTPRERALYENPPPRVFLENPARHPTGFQDYIEMNINERPLRGNFARRMYEPSFPKYPEYPKHATFPFPLVEPDQKFRGKGKPDPIWARPYPYSFFPEQSLYHPKPASSINDGTQWRKFYPQYYFPTPPTPAFYSKSTDRKPVTLPRPVVIPTSRPGPQIPRYGGPWKRQVQNNKYFPPSRPQVNYGGYPPVPMPYDY